MCRQTLRQNRINGPFVHGLEKTRDPTAGTNRIASDILRIKGAQFHDRRKRAFRPGIVTAKGIKGRRCPSEHVLVAEFGQPQEFGYNREW
ncbi:hypothetical protein [Octadecabacter arcticus]|jgi:hypothetical protein|uniref:hypothetical protein n=1 Tax=Octadecabacter arcticus TaxID=53946 RepID=UPI0006848AEC|nr:hypothetical protein [Octadecabacter arcticus]